MELRDKVSAYKEGELIIIPRGVEHTYEPKKKYTLCCLSRPLPWIQGNTESEGLTRNY